MDAAEKARRRREYHAQVEENIARAGWHAQAVFDPKGEQPHFLYTVGLERKRLPDLIMIGLPVDTMHVLVHNMVSWMTEHGAPRHGQRIDGIVDGYPVVLIDCELEVFEHLMTMTRLHALDSPRAMQIVWPNKHGRFPWQSFYDQQLTPQQVFGPAPKDDP